MLNVEQETEAKQMLKNRLEYKNICWRKELEIMQINMGYKTRCLHALYPWIIIELDARKNSIPIKETKIG